MLSFIESSGMDSAVFFQFVANISFKALLVGGIVWACLRLLRVKDSAVIHRAYTFVLVGMLTMPALVVITPRVEIPIDMPRISWISTNTAETTGNDYSSVNATSPAPIVSAAESPHVASEGSDEITKSAHMDSGSPDWSKQFNCDPRTSEFSPESLAGASPLRGSETAQPIAPAKTESMRTLAKLLIAIYFAGVLGLLLRMLVGVIKCSSLLRNAKLVQLEGAVREFAGDVTVMESNALQVPVTVGLWSPKILLPADWQSWPADDVAMALSHEGEHIIRRDTWTALLAALNCAIYWFHPLAWILSRRLSDLSEHACDDAVISSVATRADYAATLVSLASRLTPDTPRYRPTCVGMARQTSVESRVLRIIDQERPLSARLSWRKTSTLALGVLALASLAAAISMANGSTAVAAVNNGNPETPATSPDDPNEDPAPDKASTQIKGVVLSPAGEPVADAEVRLMKYSATRRSYGARVAKSNNQGEFQFDEVSSDKHRLVAYSGDLASRKKRFTGIDATAGDENIQLQLQNAPSIDVQVKDQTSGEPMPETRVSFSWTDTQRDHITDKLGKVTLRGLTNEVWTIKVEAKGYCASRHAINLTSTDSAEIVVKLARGFELYGKVIDDTGEPVSNLNLNAYGLDTPGKPILAVKTDARGRYRLSYLPINGVLIKCTRDGYARIKESVTPKVPALGEQEFNLTLERLTNDWSVVGVVQDVDGKPIANVTLSDRRPSWKLARTTKSDAEGRFRLGNVYKSPAGHGIYASAKGYAPQRIPFQPGTSAKPAQITVTLEKGHAIKGVVVDESGNPVEKVSVSAGSNAWMTEKTKTDENGRFAFDSLEADVEFNFRKSTYSSVCDAILSLDQDSEVTVVLKEQGRIRGIVFDEATGKLVTPFRVRYTFSPDRNPEDPSGTLSAGDGEIFSNSDATFELGNLIQGMPLQVTVEAEGYRREVKRRVIARPAATATANEFRLKPILAGETKVVAGQLTDAQGAPVVGAQIRLIVTVKKIPFPRTQYPFNWQMIQIGQIEGQAMVSQFLSASTNAKGRFKFEQVQPGAEILLAYWGDGISQSRVHSIEKLSAERRENMEIKTVAAGKVTGSIDREQRPIVSRISLSGGHSSHSAKVSFDGRKFEIKNVPPGTYELQVYVDDRAKQSDTFVSTKVVDRISVEVQSDQTTTMNIPQASPPSKATSGAKAKSKKRRQKKRQTTRDTTLASDGMPAVERVDEVDGDKTILRGRVVDETGAGVPDARIWMPIDRRKNQAEAASDRDGNFSLRVPRWDPTDVKRAYDSDTVWVYVSGHTIGTTSAHRQLRNGFKEPMLCTLGPVTDTAFIVTDENDVPVVGATVEPYYIRVESYDIPPTPMKKLTGGVTDQTGRADLPSVSRERLYQVEVRKQGYGTQRMRLTDSKSSPAVRRIKLRPTGRLEIQLSSESPVKFDDYSFYVDQSMDGDFTIGAADGKVGPDGQITVPNFAEGKIELVLGSKDASGELRPRIPKDLAVFSDDTTKVGVTFEKTVRVKGRVLTKPDSKPVAGALISLNYGTFRQSEIVTTDANGEYAANVLSGYVRRQLILTPNGFRNWIVEESSWSNRIEVPAEKDVFELPPLEMVETAERTGKLIGRDGEPLEEVMVFPIVKDRRYNGGVSDAEGVVKFRLPVGLEVEDYEVSSQERDISGEATVVTTSPLVLQYE